MNLSFSAIVAALLALAVTASWYNSMRAREIANRIADEACRRQSLQLLDGTVALAGLRPRLGASGACLERTYVFDYTADGVQRSSGFIVLRGQRVQHIGLDAAAIGGARGSASNERQD